jgi:hypothetical protein
MLRLVLSTTKFYGLCLWSHVTSRIYTSLPTLHLQSLHDTVNVRGQAEVESFTIIDGFRS